jgi:hypothetical protein
VRAHLGRLAAAALAMVALAGCSRDPRPPKSAEAAARLFVRMASARDPDWSLVCAKETIDADPVHFAATASHVRELGAGCAVAGAPAAAGRDREAVELACALAGGGKASLSLTAERRPDGTWRVVSIEGPGIGWPRRATFGEGTTTSAPP